MWERIRKFIAELRGSSEERRKRWLIGLSLVSMLGVISLWVFYMQATQGPQEAVARERVSQKKPGVGATISVGAREVLAEAGALFSRGAGLIRDVLGLKNEVVVQGTERNFVLDSLPEIQLTPLP